jgi:hypothetical protein
LIIRSWNWFWFWFWLRLRFNSVQKTNNQQGFWTHNWCHWINRMIWNIQFFNHKNFGLNIRSWLWEFDMQWCEISSLCTNPGCPLSLRKQYQGLCINDPFCAVNIVRPVRHYCEADKIP